MNTTSTHTALAEGATPRRHPWLVYSLALLMLVGAASCSSDDTSAGETAADATAGQSDAAGMNDAAGAADAGGDDDAMAGGDDAGAGGDDAGGSEPTACTEALAEVESVYDDADAAALGPCSGAGTSIAASLMNLSGVSIDNAGETLAPCVAVACDDTYAYVASNALPHYDFVATTPNALVENRMLWRIPLQPTAVAATGDGDDAAALGEPGGSSACVDAYNSAVAGNAYTTREPGMYCTFEASDERYLQETLSSGAARYRKIPCLDAMGVSINGVPVFGPNEGPNPDPWGNPMFSMPTKAGGSMTDAMLDLCLGHTANAMHYHGLNEACMSKADDGGPAQSYAVATSSWDLDALLDASCTAESPVVGWAPDGYPIKGPCACVARDGAGACTDLRRVRSAWVYQGLSAWGDAAGEAAALGDELKACTSDADCGGFFCRPVFVEGSAADGPELRCVQPDYNWCSHRYVDRTAGVLQVAGYAWLDRCNGLEGPDGYAYHATGSFPYVPACFRGEPSDSLGQAVYVDGTTMGGGAPGGGPGGGGDPPPCDAVPQGMPCCGDNICGGPETAANCPADCAG